MLKTGQIFRQRGKVVGRCGEHQVGHAGVIAARTGAKIGNRLGQVFAALSGQSRDGAIALKLVEMAAGAPHRVLGAKRSRRNILRRPRLAQVAPRLFREKFRNREHVVLLEG